MCQAFATAERALVATTAVEVSRFVRPLVFLLNSYPSHPFPPTVQFAFLRPTVSKKKSEDAHLMKATSLRKKTTARYLRMGDDGSVNLW